MDFGGHSFKYKIEQGCAQGSRCGPSFFVSAANELIRGLKRCDVDVLMYADDVLLIVNGSSVRKIETKAQLALNEAVKLSNSSNLKFNVAKTQAMLVRTPKRFGWPYVTLNGEQLVQSNTLTYLGVIIDEWLTWRNHVRHATKKCSKLQTAFLRLMGLSWRLGPAQRRMLHEAVLTPACLYAVEIWGKVIEKHEAKSLLWKLDNRAARGITCAYPKVPLAKLIAISGIIPLVFRIVEKYQKSISTERSREGLRRRNCEISAVRLLKEWLSGQLVGKTELFVPMNMWGGKQKLPMVNMFHATQFITGQGKFASHLSKYLNMSPKCPGCDYLKEDVTRSFFECEQHEQKRKTLLHANGIVTKKDLYKIWDNFSDFTTYAKYYFEWKIKLTTFHQTM